MRRPTHVQHGGVASGRAGGRWLAHLRLDRLEHRFPARPVRALYVFVNGFLTIALLAAVAMISGTPFVFPSLGPTAFLLFVTPTAPTASPRNTLLGHAVGIACGWAALGVTGLADAGPAIVTGVSMERIMAAALSLAGTGAVMVLLRAEHPPAGATTLIVSLGIVTRPLHLVVIEVAVALLALQAIVINRLAGIEYPRWAAPPRPAARPTRGAATLPAALGGAAAALLLMAAIYVGSRGLRDFDSALIGYAVATIFATAAIVYRYLLWLARPPTRRSFVAGWRRFLSWRNFTRYGTLVPVQLWRDLIAQTFIARRSRARWLAHQAIFWGVLVSLLITLPLTFGWIRFTLVPPDTYQLWLVGVPVLRFPIEAGTGFAVFHALDVTALLVIAGVSWALWRRVTDVGLLTGQRFGFDLVPLVLLFAIAVTGLALTASSKWWGGSFYWFISLTHQAMVVAWLLVLPFGKFFHVVQRPASVGVSLYQRVNQDLERRGDAPRQACRRCGAPLPSAPFVADLKGILGELHQDYDLGPLGSLQDYCPRCKRALRSEAYYRHLGRRFL
jgi:hypothetical protein